MSQLARANRRMNRLKAASPKVTYVWTNMTQWSNNSVSGSYFPTSGDDSSKLDVFWGKFRCGDVIDAQWVMF